MPHPSAKTRSRVSLPAQASPLALAFLASPLARHRVYGPDLRDAYEHARRLGLDPDDAEDCAMNFLLHKLTQAKPFGQDPALRRCCARDFARDARRSLTRRFQQEVSQADHSGPDAENGPEVADAGLTPEQALLALALGALLLSLLLRLRPAAGQLIRRHYLDGESIADLATSLAQTPHAVEQTLHRSRRRLRSLLEADGVGVADLL